MQLVHAMRGESGRGIEGESETQRGDAKGGVGGRNGAGSDGVAAGQTGRVGSR